MIELLSQETIEKIAAGEVVEKPLSVVKELTENSIDAGATAITVEIKEGGIKYIRVTDNGSGIKPEEVRLAFLRHSTSKINSADDLMRLTTLGFRGEALFSIAAVSNVNLITKVDGQMLGVNAVIEAGEVLSEEESAAPGGSTFIVKNLFFNTPARLKFLKSPSTEAAAVEDLIEYLALSRPDISFKFISDGKERIFTSGTGRLADAVYEIFGVKADSELLYTEEEAGGFKVKGYIGKPSVSRGNRKQEVFFVNGRFIRDTMLSRALEEGYRGVMMQHKFPICVLSLEFPDGSTDVNVHPSKMEVRFDDTAGTQKALTAIVADRLKKNEDIRISPVPEPEPGREAVPAEEEKIPAAVKELPVRKTFVSHPEPFERKAIERTVKIKQESAIDTKPETKPETVAVQEKFFFEASSKPDHRLIGQVFGTYWLIEFDDRLYVLDQHAAHEKVLYEETMRLINEKTMTSQLLAPPVVVALSASEERLLLDNMDSFTDAGFMIEHFEGRDYRIVGVPASLPKVDFADLFMNALSEGLSGMSRSNELITERVASLSCKAAVKGNHIMSIVEASALIDELFELEDPYHCPHGRPTMIGFTRQDMDKRFKRIV